jgi:hypothetical protein
MLLGRISLIVVLGVAARSAQAQSDPTESERSHRIELLADLDEGSLSHWKEQRLARRPSRYRVVMEDGRAVVQAESYGGNSGIFRALRFAAKRVRAIAWRWRVAAPLDGNRKEREKRGDDFAARVFVIFDAREGPWSGRALCYVWSASQPVGSMYRSPYSEDVAMIVVESGGHRASSWVDVRRDVLRDFRTAFGAAPDSLTAVAIMVDTDNTRSRATAWFESMGVELSRPAPN